MHNGSLANRVAVVTGASSGIGAAIAVRLAEAGADVMLVGRDAARLDQVARCARPGRTACSIVECRDPDSGMSIVGKTLDMFGRIDIVVPCAGVFHEGRVETVSVEQLDELYEVNVRAPYLLVSACVPHLGPGSTIVFVSSNAGIVGFSEMAAYCATKGAVEQLCRSLALELAERGIRVNAVAPGLIRTPMTAADIDGSEEFQRLFVERIPLLRPGRPQEIAEAVAFLASDGAAFVHGSSLVVDGGWNAG